MGAAIMEVARRRQDGTNEGHPTMRLSSTPLIAERLGAFIVMRKSVQSCMTLMATQVQQLVPECKAEQQLALG